MKKVLLVKGMLAAIVARLLAKSPADRYQNVESLLADLRAVQTLLQHLHAHIRIVRQPGTVDPELLGVAAIGKDVRRQHAAAVIVDGPEHRRARAIAE